MNILSEPEFANKTISEIIKMVYGEKNGQKIIEEIRNAWKDGKRDESQGDGEERSLSFVLPIAQAGHLDDHVINPMRTSHSSIVQSCPKGVQKAYQRSSRPASRIRLWPQLTFVQIMVIISFGLAVTCPEHREDGG